jgi:hypothetical protein
MNRGYVALGIAAVLAAVIGLYVIPGADDRTDATVSRDRDPSRAASDTGQNRPTVPSRAPSLPARASDRAVGSGASDEYVVGGVRIRDHRSGERERVDLPPAIHPPGGRKIASELTSSVGQKVRAVVAECAASVPQDARGDRPRADGEITIAIKNQLATVTAATFQLRDVVGAVVDPVKQCLEHKTIGVATASGDEPDVASYDITMSFRLP